ncbi:MULTISPECIES: urea transporter [unclassified Actinotalea]|uniref:urea transporter n=1 Tax=unclassified Actinotalea TaxID=2638618 RepID=UPI0015F767DC|nr:MULTISPECIES: urea transporter [unclassified Actinotalea]
MASTGATAQAPGTGTALTGRAFAHGLSQIFFQANVWTGLLILAAFVVADVRMAVLVVIGTLVSTATGALMGARRQDLRIGMQGYNGALLGAAVFAAMGGAQAWSYVATVVGAVLCAPVMWLFVRLFATRPLARFDLPATTAPFCTVAGVVYAVTMSLHVSSTPQHVPDEVGRSFLRSLLTNVSEVVLVESVWAGALILLGLFIASWRVGVAAVLGSVVGSLCALALGESSETIGSGLANYSGVLTAIALAVVFLRSTVAAWLYATLGAALTAVLTLLLTDATSAPHYTWPYILTTWVLLVVAAFVPALRRT